jgi:hypothetical protein
MSGHLNFCATRLFGKILLQIHAGDCTLNARFNKTTQNSPVFLHMKFKLCSNTSAPCGVYLKAKMEHIDHHIVPYTTKSGLQIGCNYTPPARYYTSYDAELLQSALLGIEPKYSQRKVLSWTSYILCLVATFALLIALVD